MSPVFPQIFVNGIALFAGIVAIGYYIKLSSSFGGQIGNSLKIFVASMSIWMVSFSLCMLKGFGILNILKIHLKLVGGSAFLLFAYGFYKLNKSLKTLEA